MAGIRRSFAKFLDFGDGPADASWSTTPSGWTGSRYIPFLRDFGPHFTINRMLTFDSVKLRLEREQPLTCLEFNYMVMQAYDFVELSRRHGCRCRWAAPTSGATSSTASSSAGAIDGRSSSG